MCYLIKYKEPDKIKVTANPSGGSVDEGTKVYLTPSVSGATIYYTTDGTTPTTSSTLYTSSGVTIDKAMTLSAIAHKSGYGSEVSTWYYTVNVSIPINEANFPDANFRNYLLEQDYGKDGKITESEISDIRSIDVSGKEISSLKGIEYFTFLTSLSCSGNKLASLDVSKNTALKWLNCRYNQLATLDVSKNTAMTSLDCGKNQLAKLDVSKNSELTELSCGSNIITTLDISRNTKLEKIYCYTNKLSSLDLSNHTVLEYVECQLNQLSSLDVSNCTKLFCINCCANRISGTAMDKLINSLPYKTGYFRVISTSTINGGLEQNVCNTEQVAATKAKGWIPQYSTFSFSSGWQEYEGSAIIEPYAVLSNDGKTVTFYYDDKKESRGGADIRSSHHGTATIAVFDASFANYRPTSTAYWFSGCSELTTIKGMENLYTDDVTDMEFMFYNCNNLTNLNIKGFNTEKVTSMYGMFCRCLSLEKLDVSGFKMDNVTNTNRMFASCNRLTTLELSNFNTSNVKDMTRMFGSCKSLTTVYVNEKKWNTANVTEGDGVFADCAVLVGGNGTKFDETHTDVEYARIDKAGSPGYLTDIADSKVTGITLNKTKLALQTNQAETLTATVMPDNALDKTVTWSSSNTSVATVDDNGKVTAVSAGTATITCTANGGSNVKATCEVTVTNPKPEKITLPAEATVTAGNAITLTPTITPADAIYTLTWTSDDESIATVDANGVVTGIKKGQTFINVETDNGKTAYCKLTVTAPEPVEIILPKNATVIVGEPLKLTPTLTPEDAETVLTWYSDDETIVRVTADGTLIGVAEGLAIVTAKASNDITSNACKVKVELPSAISDVQTDIKAKTPIYTVSGQRIKTLRKGINIVGGKKVVIK